MRKIILIILFLLFSFSFVYAEIYRVIYTVLEPKIVAEVCRQPIGVNDDWDFLWGKQCWKESIEVEVEKFRDFSNLTEAEEFIKDKNYSKIYEMREIQTKGVEKQNGGAK